MKSGKLTKKDIKELQKQLPEIPEYHYICMNCGKEYDLEEKYNNQSCCIYCGYGNVYCEEDEN